MAKIGYLVVCQEVGEGPNRGLMISHPYPAITPLSIPGNYSFVVAFSLYDLKAGTKYDLTVDIKDPNGTIINHGNFNFTFDEGPDGQTPYGEMNMSFPNFPFRIPGLYTIDVAVSPDAKKQIEIPVHISGTSL